MHTTIALFLLAVSLTTTAFGQIEREIHESFDAQPLTGLGPMSFLMRTLKGFAKDARF